MALRFGISLNGHCFLTDTLFFGKGYFVLWNAAGLILMCKFFLKLADFVTLCAFGAL